MIKKLISLLIISLFIFVSCTKANDESIEENNKVAVSTSSKETNSTNQTINLLGKSYYNTKYITLGDLLFFPDPKNNQRLSVSKRSVTGPSFTECTFISAPNSPCSTLKPLSSHSFINFSYSLLFSFKLYAFSIFLRNELKSNIL